VEVYALHETNAEFLCPSLMGSKSEIMCRNASFVLCIALCIIPYMAT